MDWIDVRNNQMTHPRDNINFHHSQNPANIEILFWPQQGLSPQLPHINNQDGTLIEGIPGSVSFFISGIGPCSFEMGTHSVTLINAPAGMTANNLTLSNGEGLLIIQDLRAKEIYTKSILDYNLDDFK